MKSEGVVATSNTAGIATTECAAYGTAQPPLPLRDYEIPITSPWSVLCIAILNGYLLITLWFFDCVDCYILSHAGDSVQILQELQQLSLLLMELLNPLSPYETMKYQSHHQGQYYVLLF